MIYVLLNSADELNASYGIQVSTKDALVANLLDSINGATGIGHPWTNEREFVLIQDTYWVKLYQSSWMLPIYTIDKTWMLIETTKPTYEQSITRSITHTLYFLHSPQEITKFVQFLNESALLLFHLL